MDQMNRKVRALMKSDPAITYEAAYARVHAEDEKIAATIREKVVSLARANPVAFGLPNVPRAEPFDVARALEREKTRLMRQGVPLAEAVTEAREIVIQQQRDHITKQRAEIESWSREHGATIVPMRAAPPTTKVAPAPQPAAPAPTFVPLGMTPGEAAQAALLGRLPTRSQVWAAGQTHMKLMSRVQELQAQGQSYDEAFLSALHEMNAPASKAGAK